MTEYTELLLEHQEYQKRLAMLYQKRDRINEMIIYVEQRRDEITLELGKAVVGELSQDNREPM